MGKKFGASDKAPEKPPTSQKTAHSKSFVRITAPTFLHVSMNNLFDAKSF